ncbi:ASCH domain-containing protein [Rhodobacter capsulatus]|uniref:ASCH domain-containing protein n=1 Tax=Rhodobacter capsulatus TaxID=1061 RepID=A0A4U1JRA9_RHOCA|nr:ASCH domain-containing protein [Rhodobacter capsulatus]TKD17936.1 ASCH domain-containing protein [Rhodobacter capsulatus]
MVAYSFQKRFAPKIIDGSKRQTIRSQRKRHARPGELLQLFTGMRTVHCKKIVPDVRCIGADPICIEFDTEGKIVSIEVDGSEVADVDAFAVADGFEAAFDMAGFWVMSHGLMQRFRGTLISWDGQ